MGNGAIMNLLLQNVAWQFTQLSKKLGLIGGLGSALLLACSLVYLSKLIPLNQQISDAKNTLENAPENTSIIQKMVLNTKPLPVKNAGDDIAAFKQMLPEAASLHEWLTMIDKTASKQKLTLKRGDYKYNKVGQSQISNGFYLSQYEIVLPVTGQYAQIRQFIAQVLQLQPALALSDLKITRENSLAINVEARLAFVLYLQGDIKSGIK
jgi:Tfp pilus assembly protein PilO